MASHRVCVMECPHCGHEKVLKRLRQRKVLSYQCKNCKLTSSPDKHQICFYFQGMKPVNAL